MGGKRSKPLDIEFSVKKEYAPAESDLRLWGALEAAGISFSAGDKGNAYVDVTGPRGRYVKSVRLASKTEQIREQELRRISCKVSGGLPDYELMVFCLQQNRLKKVGKWSLEVDEQERTSALHFEANVDANLEPQTLKKVVFAVGLAAHEFKTTKQVETASTEQPATWQATEETTTMTDKLDPRVPAALDLAGLKYEVDENGIVAVLVGIDDSGNRSQVVFITSTTTEFGSQELRTVFSPAYFDEAPEWKVLAYCLKQNFETKLGKWSLQVNEEKRKTGLAYGANIDANLSPSQLGGVVWAVGKEADGLEKKMSDRDSF